MKTHTLILTLLCLCGLSQAKDRVIEQPPFIAANTKVLEIEKVVLTDTATVFYMKAYFRPKYWIQLNKNSFLFADNGQRYNIKSTEGLTLGEKFWMPESGEADFKMYFPPLPSSVRSVDFSEGENENFWTIWGISLTGKLPKLDIPKELTKQKLDYDAPLPILEIKKAKAIFSGKILEYRPEMKMKLNYYYMDVLSGEYIEGTIDVDPNGSFSKEFDLISPTTLNMRLGETMLRAFLVPGENLSATYNLREIFRKDSRVRKDKKSYGKPAYFSGYLAAYNEEKAMNEFYSETSYEQLMTEIVGMTPEQFKEYVLNEYKQKLDSLERTRFSANYKHVIKTDLELSVIQSLLTADDRLKQAYVISNKLDNDAARKYKINTKIAFPEGYFDCLKDLEGLKSPFVFYTSGYNYTLMFLHWLFPDKQIPNTVYTDLTNKSIDELVKVQRMAIQINEFSPLTEEQFRELTALSNPVYLQELTGRNDALLAKLEANRQKTGYKVNEAGEVANEDLFYSMTSKFKGKVLLVDIWATWCGPCRMAMKEMLPMKEALAGKDVVYIYITGETSPLKTWENMIPDIHGEHFRVTNEQWNFLYKELKIGGVPTYFILDRKGDIAYKTTGFPGADAMKKELLKVLNK